MSDNPDHQATNYSAGAMRSADGEHFEFSTLPRIGVLAVARTSYEGAQKYGAGNYLRGVPARKVLARVFRHPIMDALGDRSEPNPEHAERKRKREAGEFDELSDRRIEDLPGIKRLLEQRRSAAGGRGRRWHGGP